MNSNALKELSNKRKAVYRKLYYDDNNNTYEGMKDGSLKLISTANTTKSISQQITQKTQSSSGNGYMPSGW